MSITARELREATLRGDGPLAKADDNCPVFLLVGSDPNASELVDKWAIWTSVLVPDAGSKHLADKVAEATLIAEEMRRWPIKKNPD